MEQAFCSKDGSNYFFNRALVHVPAENIFLLFEPGQCGNAGKF
jgi:hypothetical protein